MSVFLQIEPGAQYRFVGKDLKLPPPLLLKNVDFQKPVSEVGGIKSTMQL